MIAASILDIKEPKEVEVRKLSNLDIDFIHIDVMDGIFVENKSMSYYEYSNLVKNINKPLDVHLMVSNVKNYIDNYININPEYITFHYEAVSDVMSVIKYIKSKGIKVGMSIKPSTEVNEVNKYLSYLDLILVMSVEPGRGGQSFIENSTLKIKQLNELRKANNYNYIIEVDGGINNLTINKCEGTDMFVVGSYITKNDYEESIIKLRNNL